MRIRVIDTFNAYWNYAVQEFRKGEEHIGELAEHLADNAPKGYVDVLEDDRPGRSEKKAAGKKAAKDPEQRAGADGGGQGGGDGQQAGTGAGDHPQGDPGGQSPESADEPPVDGTIDALMTWIGDDPDRAQRALAAEQAKDKPRATVIKRLGGDS